MSKLFWLASYPKSGNTWFRSFLSNYLEEGEDVISINRMKTDGIFSARSFLDNMIGVETSNLTYQEIDRLRPLAYEWIAENLEKNSYIKVHDAFTNLEGGRPLLGVKNAKALYFVRNPLDVAVSFSNHLVRDLDQVVRNMGNPEYGLARNEKRLTSQIGQKLLTWSGHVESWINTKELPVHVVRYEDMKHDPVNTFMKAVLFLEMEPDMEKIERAIENSSFQKLKQEEEREGFRERPYLATCFFRKGEVGDWRNHLNGNQIGQIVEDHRETMKKLGYLNDKDQIQY